MVLVISSPLGDGSGGGTGGVIRRWQQAEMNGAWQYRSESSGLGFFIPEMARYRRV